MNLSSFITEDSTGIFIGVDNASKRDGYVEMIAYPLRDGSIRYEQIIFAG